MARLGRFVEQDGVFPVKNPLPPKKILFFVEKEGDSAFLACILVSFSLAKMRKSLSLVLGARGLCGASFLLVTLMFD